MKKLNLNMEFILVNISNELTLLLFNRYNMKNEVV